MSTNVYPVSTIAKLFDLTERRVQQLAKEGVIPKSSKGKYELVPSVKGYINYLKAKSFGTNDIVSSDIAIDRGRLLKMQADKLAMEMDTAKGQLLDREEVKAGWINLLTRCRARLLAIPNRLAYQLTSTTNVHEIAQILKQAIYEALEELATKNIMEVKGENESNQNNNQDNQQNKEYTNAEDNINWRNAKTDKE